MQTEFSDKPSVEVYVPVTAPDFVRLAGYTVAGDGGGALYKRVSSEPSHAGKVRDGAGNWYELAEFEVDQFAFGAKGDFRTIVGIITAGSKNLYVADGTFTAADVGKRIFVGEADALGECLVTTIASFIDNQNVVLTNAAGTTTDGSIVSGVANGYGGYGTDDTAAIQGLHAFCVRTGARYRYDSAQHYVNGEINFTTAGDASAATLYYDAAAFLAASAKSCLLVGKRSGRITGIAMSLPAVVNITHKIGDAWTKGGTGFYETVAAVEAANVNNCLVWNVSSYGGGRGLSVKGYSAGTQGSTFYINSLVSNQTNILFSAGDTLGWVNENTFVGGGVGLGNGETTDGRTIRMLWSDSNGNAPPNNNRFRGINFEGIATKLDITGTDNIWDHCRWEVLSSVPVFIQRSTANWPCVRNTIRGGWNASAIAFTEANGGAAIAWNELDTPLKKVFNGDKELFLLAAQSGIASVITVFASGDNPLLKAYNDPSYVARWAENVMSYKRKTDVAPRLITDGNAGLIFLGDGTVSPPLIVGSSANTAFTFSQSLRPAVAGVGYLGTSSSFPWAGGYVQTAFIVTSDASKKKWRGGLTDAERRVSRKIASGVGLYQLLEAIAEKGKEKARLHAGVIAQDVEAHFASEGLGAGRYGLFVIDPGEPILDDDGNVLEPAKESYGIRYSELLAFVLAGVAADQVEDRARMDALEARVKALEAA